MIGVANRLNRSASAFYRTRFGLGVQEWRMILALARNGDLTVGDAALSADLDTASASRALKLLKAEGYATLEVTTSRGRATIARLTEKGWAMHARLAEAGAMRAARITAGLSPKELVQLNAMLGRIRGNVDALIQDLTQE
nr:MarR family winged helix-turn-helix transcriptional regulator [Mesobacterium pallidum]